MESQPTIPGLEQAGERLFKSHIEHAQALAKTPEWDYTDSGEGSYVLTYMTDLDAEDGDRWAVGDIEFEKNSTEYTISIRCDKWDYNEAAESKVIAARIIGLDDAIQILLSRLSRDKIIQN